MIKKTNYFYIDESGHLNNDSKIFIHGCIKTDTSEEIDGTIIKLKDVIKDDIYFQDTVALENFIKQGFHAVDNHPDIRAQFYKILPLLNYRAYFVLLNKTDAFYKSLKIKYSPSEVFAQTLKKLLTDRIIANKEEKNIFYFETIEFSDNSLKNILDKYFCSFNPRMYKIEYYIVSKKENNLSVVDYLNYIFFKLYERNDFFERMKENFELIKPKIGSIYIMNQDKYYSRKTKVELIKILNIMGGTLR